ncbi:MAG: hypothetical protein JHC95_20115, partial [Solirubrobacteraceae bacterium]|nr:hypothetical protein [Solirubrobacteraceae bacterium]
MTDLKTRTYEGNSLDEILPKIREELGDDAIVVRQREGLKGGVGGFFQKRIVEVEARSGHAIAAESKSGRFEATDGPAVGPEPMPAATPAATSSVAEAMLAEAAGASAPSGFSAQLADAAQAQAEQPYTTVGGAGGLTVDDILAGTAGAEATAPTVAPVEAYEPPAPAATAPAPAPVETAMATMEGAAGTSRTRGVTVTTSPQVDAIPAAEAAPEQVAQAPVPVAQPVPAPMPIETPESRPARAERVIETLSDRGMTAGFAQQIVDQVVTHRVPFSPGARLSALVTREVARWIPTRPAGTPGVAAFVGAGGSGKTSVVAGIARAYAEAGVRVACVAIRSTDAGASLRATLEGSGVEVYAPVDDADATATIERLRGSRIVLLDTPAVSPRDAAEIKALGRQLGRLKTDEVHLCTSATQSLDVARDGLEALRVLKPSGLTITHADETDRIGGSVQLAIDSGIALS